MINIFKADLINPNHAKAAINLLNNYSKDEMGGSQELPEFVKDNLAVELQRRKQVHVVLAFEDKKPVGLTILMEGFSTFSCMPLLNVHDIFVLREYRGQGISRKLLFKAEEIARTLGCCKLTLEVLEGNKTAQAAYKANGFAAYQLDPKMGQALFWQKKLASS